MKQNVQAFLDRRALYDLNSETESFLFFDRKRYGTTGEATLSPASWDLSLLSYLHFFLFFFFLPMLDATLELPWLYIMENEI